MAGGGTRQPIFLQSAFWDKTPPHRGQSAKTRPLSLTNRDGMGKLNDRKTCTLLHC